MDTDVLDLSTSQKSVLVNEIENNNLSPSLCTTCHCEPKASTTADKCENCLEVVATESNSANNDSFPVDLSITSKTEQDVGNHGPPEGTSSSSNLDLPSGQENSLGSNIASAEAIASTSLAYNVLLQRIILASAVASQGKVACKKYKCSNCSASFNSKETLDGHVRSYCPSVRPAKLTSPNLTPTLPSNPRHTTIPTTSASTSENTTESPNKHDFALTRSKKFKCDKCGVMFSQLNTLKTHQKVYCSGGGKRGPSPSRILSPGTTTSATTRIESPNTASVLQRDNESPTTSTTSANEEPSFVTLNCLQNLLVDSKRNQIMANSTTNIAPLPLRKRSSPNSDNEGADLKPFAKYQCRNCHIKFNEEKNLEGHEKYYCAARLQGNLNRSLISPRSDEIRSDKSFIQIKSPPAIETQHPTSKISNGHSSLSSSSKTADNSSNDHSLAFCDLCSMTTSEPIEEHMKSFHKISNKLFFEKIIKLCQNSGCFNHQTQGGAETEIDG